MEHRSACPTCRGPRKGPAHNPTFPFCSARCKLADLGRWLDGRYAIPGEPALDDDEAPERGRLH